ncbi:hypothetical protein B1C81_25850 [Streptomyces sp. HG99]|nr:hypothetical protein B1C81_25850 [Streptomyces sp. HG99]
MAGESPDRSKQHESSASASSAEPTPGAPASVPGPARGVASASVSASASASTPASASASASADPRLAVARERAAAVRGDQATAVFSTKALTEPEADGASDAEEKGTEGDSRLRAAVAAWVAGSGDAAAAEGDGGSGGGSGAAERGAGAEPADADADADANANANANADADADDTGADADGGADGAASEAEEASGEASVRDATADADADDAQDTSGEASVTDEPGDEPDAESASGADPKTEAETGTEPASEDGPKSGGGSASVGAVRAGDDNTEAESGTESGTESAPAPASEDGPKSGGGSASVGAVRTGDDNTEAESGTESGTESAPASENEPKAEAGTEAGTESAPVSASASEDAPKPKPRGATSDNDAAPSPNASAKSAPEDSPKSPSGGSPKATSADSEPVAAEPQVDQPTAVFKAVRPPAVDQPTTMLKLGSAKPGDRQESKRDAKPESKVDQPTTMLKLGAAKPGDRQESKRDAKPESKPDTDPAAEGTKSKPAGESDSERTSKFVALKPLDEPRRPAAGPASQAGVTGPASPALTPPEAGRVSPAEATTALPQIGPERTTQQPLPPRPPLDLLAELTNTPPPPETPVRTIVRRVKIWTPLVVLLLIIGAIVQAVRPLPTPTLTLTAEETHAFEGDKVSLPWPGEGQGWMDVNGIGTMDSFGEQEAVPIGSVAKAMTAYVVLKDKPLKAGEDGPSITVDATAEKEGGYDADGESTLNTVKAGSQISQRDALSAIMIPSANNIARLLARWDANGSEQAFVDKMNAAAKDLGMKNTTYTDPSGLKETTVSTAEDQVKLGNELVKMQALMDITKLPEWTDPSGKKWRNYNTLVPFDNAIGIKTGSTTKAGGNLLFAATKEVGGETVTVVGAVLGQHTAPIIDTVNAVSKEAMLAAQDALTADTILKKGDVVGYVDDGLGGRTPVVATKDVSAVGWAGQTVKLQLADGGTTLPHEAKAGTEVGVLTVGDGTGDAVEVPVALQSDLMEPGFGKKLTRLG